MRFYALFNADGRHVAEDGAPEHGVETNSLDSIFEALKSASKRLRTVPIDDLIGLCDAIATQWTKPDHPIARLIRDQGLGFVPFWMRRGNLERICALSMRGDLEALDRFVALPGDPGRLFRAQPRGVVVHWLAGNVPVLGLLSFLQAVLSKNVSILKAPRYYAGLLPTLLESMRGIKYENNNGIEYSGDLFADSAAVVYADKDDSDAARHLSANADVRVAWGGRESVEAIMNLPRRFGTEDIIFGPKVSFVVVGKESLSSKEDVLTLGRRIARDVVAFDQRGCNSPHTVFVERGGQVAPKEFASILAESMSDTVSGRSIEDLQAADSIRVLTARTEYDLRGDAYYDQTPNWTVLFAEEDAGLAEPVYCRTLYVRGCDDIFEVPNYCSINTQSAALACGSRAKPLADRLTEAGVERCPAPGSMSLYESPWDGMFPIDRMSRWVSMHVDPKIG